MRPPAASGGLLADAANAGARCDAVALYEPYDLSGYPALHFEGDWLRAMLGTCVDVTLKPRRPYHFVIAQYLSIPDTDSALKNLSWKARYNLIHLSDERGSTALEEQLAEYSRWRAGYFETACTRISQPSQRIPTGCLSVSLRRVAPTARDHWSLLPDACTR